MFTHRRWCGLDDTNDGASWQGTAPIEHSSSPSRRRAGVDQPLAGVPRSLGPIDKSSRKSNTTFEGRKESQVIQTLAARIQLAKMRAEEGQALVEYALIVSLIAVVCIAALTATGTSIQDMLNKLSKDV